MNSLLSPAIALMNRLTYGMKFCLISVLFFVPLGIVSSMLVQQAYERVEVTSHALDSLALVRATSDALRSAELVRDLDAVNTRLGQGGKADSIEERLTQTRARLIEQLNSLPLEADDPAARILAESARINAERKAEQQRGVCDVTALASSCFPVVRSRFRVSSSLLAIRLSACPHALLLVTAMEETHARAAAASAAAKPP